MTGVTGLHHVQVAAPPGCEPAARAFYGELLAVARDREAAAPRRAWRMLVLARRRRAARRRRGSVQAGGEGTPGAARRLRRRAGGARSLARGEGHAITWADDAEIPGQRRFHVTILGQPARARRRSTARSSAIARRVPSPPRLHTYTVPQWRRTTDRREGVTPSPIQCHQGTGCPWGWLVKRHERRRLAAAG